MLDKVINARWKNVLNIAVFLGVSVPIWSIKIYQFEFVRVDIIAQPVQHFLNIYHVIFYFIWV